ncbi:MAG: HAD family hydrolase [Ruminococcus sp.]|nr:HAD family hydrolase [Ruminococcus sp.]
MYKAVVFDLDGTLVDTIVDLANAVNEGLRKVGLPVHSVEKYKKFVGNGKEMLVKRAMGGSYDENLAQAVGEAFGKYYEAHCNDNVSAYDGCAEMLRNLSDLGVKTGVLSNKPDEFVAQILSNVYPNHSFTAAWGNRPEYPVKPDPSALLALLSEIGTEPCDCLYIGDSDVDVYTAQNAGVDMIGVEWGFRGREELLNAGAKRVVKTADEILRCLNE